MSAQGLLEEASGAEYLSFPAQLGRRTVTVQALRDPMSLGFAGVRDLLGNPEGFRALLSEGTKDKIMFLFPTGEQYVALFNEWLTVSGITKQGFGALQRALKHLDLVEADLHRFYHIDLADWLRPDGDLSTRKLSVLLVDLIKRPESAFGSELAEIDPLTKLEIMFAQYFGGMTESKKPHSFFTSRQDRIEREEMEARQRRMLNRGLSA